MISEENSDVTFIFAPLLLSFPLLWLLSEFFIFDFLQFVYDMPTCSEVVLVFLFFFYSVILGVL